MRTDTPRYQLEVDRVRAKALGISLSSIFDTVRTTFGSLYVNDFTLYGRNYHVNLQSDAAYRRDPATIRQVFVRTDGGKMVPLSTVLTLKRVVGADAIEHFNVYQSIELQVQLRRTIRPARRLPPSKRWRMTGCRPVTAWPGRVRRSRKSHR